MKHLFPFLLFLLLFSACKKDDNPTTAGFDSKNLIRRWTFKTIDADYDGKTYSVAATLLETSEAEYKADGSYAQYADKKAGDTGTWKLTGSTLTLDSKDYQQKLNWSVKNLTASELVLESATVDYAKLDQAGLIDQAMVETFEALALQSNVKFPTNAKTVKVRYRFEPSK
jgi:hypothetical protein